MIILGIHVGHNASVCVLEDGAVVAALSQEKLDDIKNSAAFPADALNALLAQLQLNASDIDAVAVAGRQIFPARSYDYLFRARPSDGSAQRGVMGLARRLEQALPGPVSSVVFGPLRRSRLNTLLRQGQSELAANLERAGLSHVPVRHVGHHECHARAAFHGLGSRSGEARPALLFTADGSGDGISSSVTRVNEDGAWETLGRTGADASIGGIYSATTRFLGMRPLEHEYKVMGLAPYAKSYADDVFARVFAPVVAVDERDPFCFSSGLDTRRFYEHLADNAVGERFDNIAAAAQRLIEERVTAWIEGVVARTGVRRAYFGGGLFMNVKLNKLIQEMSCLDEAHFMPSCGDETNAMGAAYALWLEQGAAKPLRDLYLGLSYSDDDLDAVLRDRAAQDGFAVEKLSDPADRVAELLAEGHVVARFAGANEWGARSLGNRAILAHPGRMESFFTVNDQIKCRDFWMPFAPTILDRSAPEYLEGWSMERTPAPHMITAFQATPKGRVDLCAAIHRGDGTLRPQVLTRDVNPDYYDLIDAFAARTGIGAVLNTSLNLHGKPLAATPHQALDTLKHSGLDYIVMGSYLVRKS